MANYSACALIFGGRLPFTLAEIKALRSEAGESFKKAKKYIPKLVLILSYQQQIVDGVRGLRCTHKLLKVSYFDDDMH